MCIELTWIPVVIIFQYSLAFGYNLGLNMQVEVIEWRSLRASLLTEGGRKHFPEYSNNQEVW